MPVLADAEIRRLLKFLRVQNLDAENLAFIEDELRGEFGAEFLRESGVSDYFSVAIVEIVAPETLWKLKIISYTRMRMTQRGISEREIIALFEKFLLFCRNQNQTITTGAYTVFGKATKGGLPLTLRIDIDEINENKGRAHTVTVFVGHGDAFQTVEVNLIS